MAYQVSNKPEPLGKVAPTSGIPLLITNNLPGSNDGARPAGNTNSQDDLWFNKMEIVAPITNTGSVYIGRKTMNRTTLAGVMRVLGPGVSWSVANPVGGNTYHAGDFYADVDTTGDFIYGSVDVV